MPDIFFSTNPADWTQLEGLYISEQNPPGFIQGANLSTVGIAGQCVRGPLVPTVVNSPGEFLALFGARDRTSNGSGGARMGQVHAALLNKQFGSVVVRRVLAAGATTAAHTFSDATPTQIVTISAANPGIWGTDVTVGIETATDANSNHFNIRVTYLGKQTVYQNINLSAGTDNSAVVVGADPNALIVVAKIVDGRPVNASTALSGGTEGSVAVTDYNAAMNDLAVFPGVALALVAEPVVGSAATFHSNLVTLAAEVDDRIFLTWAQAHGQSVSAEIAQVAAQITTQSDRIVWCFNSPTTLDPDTGLLFQQAPHIWMASIMCQTAVDIHPGSYDNLPYTAGVAAVTNTALARGDLINLRNAGISTLEGITEGFLFHSAVTTLLTAGKTEITRRRQADYLQLSAAARLKFYVKKKSTPENRAGLAAELTAFSQELLSQGFIIQNFAIDQNSVNSDAARSQGLEQLLWRVQLIGHTLYLVFQTQIGDTVAIQPAA